MSILVTGAGGLLGSNIVDIAVGNGHDVFATHYSDPPADTAATALQMDVTDTERLENLLAERDVSTVINCAAMTDVDECEANPEAARRINGEAPGRLAAVCSDHGVEFCQISTDYVFSDPDVYPIPENTDMNPIQTYGRTKLTGERSVQRNHADPLVARISFVFGVNQIDETLKGLPAWILKRLGDDEPIPLYTDQHISPTLARHAGEAILGLLSSDASGVYHCSNAGCTTPYEFGQYLVQIAGMRDTSLLTTSSLRDRDMDAERPTCVCLDVEKTEQELGRRQRSWKDGLRAIADYLK